MTTADNSARSTQSAVPNADRLVKRANRAVGKSEDQRRLEVINDEPITVSKSTSSPEHLLRGATLALLQALFVVFPPLLDFFYMLGISAISMVRKVSSDPKMGQYVNPALDVLADFVTQHRGIFVTLFINPVCLLWDLADFLRDWMLALQMPATGDARARREIHAQRIAKVQAQVRKHIANGAERLCTARPGYLAMSMKAGTYKQKWAGVNVHALRDLVEIDEQREVVRVEPGCNMGRLSRDLLARGWTLVVLPELDELTVGGLINGFGVETSSHKYGLLQHTCTSFELVMPNGDYIVCDANHHKDLFAAIPWSHGTLGFLVGAEMRIRRSAPYVRVQYLPCHDRVQGMQVFSKASYDNTNDFVESLVFNNQESVVMTGTLAHTVGVDGKLNSIGYWFKPWFFTHVASFLTKSKSGGSQFVEYIPLRDYYHRHTKSLFWEMQDIVPFGNQAWYRWACAWAGPPKVAVLKMTTTGKLKHLWETMHVAQDLLIPMCTLDKALDVMDGELGVYPLWLCPMRMLSPGENLLDLRDAESKSPLTETNELLHQSDRQTVQPVTTPSGSLTPPHPKAQLYVDVGAYGVPKTSNFHHIKTLQRIEAWVRSVQGYQALYADTMMNREEFRRMFDHRTYDQVRAKYEANKHMPEIWDKVNQSARA